MSRQTSAAWLKQRYAEGERDFHHINLHRANLAGTNLSWADLAGADLSGADLSWDDLTGADLSGADLKGANLAWADLAGANLSWADLTGADLTGANLSGANLKGADLTEADLTGADLTGMKNPPSGSHSLIAAVLRQAAGEDAKRRSVAGLVLISRDWCWRQFAVIAQDLWDAETRAWIVEKLGVWPQFLTLLQRYGFVDAN
jgi:uncharacterized protein YjbI with pentapeptide repeats